MTIQTPPPAPPSVPPDEPSRSDQPAIFVSKADAFLAWFKDLRAALASFVGWWPTFKGELDATIAQMNTGAGIALLYEFSAATADADPGPGMLRLSNATQNLSTVARMDAIDANGVAAAAVIDLFDDSNSVNKGLLKLQNVDDPTSYLILGVTAVTPLAGYRNITAAVLASSSADPFADGDMLLVSFVPSGDIAAGTVSSTDVQRQQYTAFTTAGTSTAFTLTPVPALTAYADGESFYATLHVAPGNAPTLNINGLGALPLMKLGSDGLYTAVNANDWQPAQRSRVTVAGNRTTFVVENIAPAIGPQSSVSFRNKVRNPRMDMAQRGASIAAAAGYTLDGWSYATNGTTAVVTVSQQADAPADNEFQYSIRVTVTTADASVAAGDLASLLQPIEGYLVRDLIGRPIAIRFRVRSSKTGTHCVSLRNSVADRSYVLTYTVNTINTWETKTLRLPEGLITAGTWNWTTGIGVIIGFTLMCGATFQTTAGAWQVGNLCATAAQVNVLDTVGNIFAVTGVQMEVGSDPGPFEHRPYGLEEQFNYRYLQPAPNMFGAQVSTTLAAFSCGLPVRMRAPPSSTLALSTITLVTGVTPAGVSGFSLAVVTPQFVRAAASFAATGAVGTPVDVTTTGLLSSEL